MGRRRRDTESESEESGSEYSESEDSYDGSASGSDSYDSGYDSSGSESSEDEEEIIKGALKDANLKKYSKTLIKNGIDSISACEKLNDKKLSKIGVKDSKDRKKILKALKNLEEGSSDEYDSDDEESQIHSILKAAGQKKAIKNFKKHNIGSMKKAKKLDDSKLKKLGVADSKARKKILKALSGGSKKSKDESESESESDSDDEGETIRRLLARASMKKYYSLFKKKGVDTLQAAKNLQHKDLREMGIHLYRERRDILEQFEKYNGEELSSVSSGSGSDDEDNVNMVHEVLRQQYMSRHIPDFDRMGITTLRQARKLTQTQLRSMGVALYLQRERLINAFADYRPKNKAIMKILIDCNLASHAREFEKLIDVEDAKNLTHSDLRAMGINLYGQRERLMRAFMEYKPEKKKKGD